MAFQSPYQAAKSNTSTSPLEVAVTLHPRLYTIGSSILGRGGRLAELRRLFGPKWLLTLSSPGSQSSSIVPTKPAGVSIIMGGLIGLQLRAFNEDLKFPLPLFRGVAKAALDCAHRTSTASSCAFCEQRRHLTAPFLTLPRARIAQAKETNGLPLFS